jgi:hypothetical protein
MSGRSGPVSEGRGWLRQSTRYVAPLLAGDLPHEISLTALGDLLRTSESIELRAELHRIPPTQALEMLQRAQTVAGAELARGGDGPGVRTAELEIEAASADELGRRIAQREQDLWKAGLQFACYGATPLAAERLRDALVRRLASLGFRSRVPTYQAAAAAAPADLSGSQPRPNGYWHTLHTDGVAAFYPFGDETIAEPGGILVGLQLDDATPIFLDRWAHSSYSWGLFGTTGAGKSFAAMLFALRTRWMHPESTIVILDPLGEFGDFAEAAGGSVLTIGDERGPRLNPLDPATTGGDRTEKAGRVGSILTALFPSLRDEEVATLDAAVNRLYEAGPEIPTFGDLIEQIPTDFASGRLRTLLEVFQSGSLRYLNGPTTVPTERYPVVVDLRGVDEAHLPFHLAYLLDWAYGQLRERVGPKLLVIDEAHLLARQASTAAYIDRIVRHVRHFDAGVLLLSQSPEDFLGNESGRSLLRNLRATLLLRLAHVSETVREFYGITEEEAKWLTRARLPREAGYSEALLRVGEAHVPLGVVASTPEYEFLTAQLGRERPERRPGPRAPAGDRA